MEGKGVDISFKVNLGVRQRERVHLNVTYIKFFWFYITELAGREHLLVEENCCNIRGITVCI